MAQEESLRVALKVTGVFEKLGAAYLVCGSLASSVHGIPRATQDIDIVADLNQTNMPSLVAALEDEFYVDAERIRNAIVRRASFNLIHLSTMFKIDVFILKNDPQSREEVRRRQLVLVGEDPGERLWVASAEDTIIQKLAWYRLGGCVSERQWSDVVGILKVQRGRLDIDYLHRAASGRKVTTLLAKAQEDSGSRGSSDS